MKKNWIRFAEIYTGRRLHIITNKFPTKSINFLRCFKLSCFLYAINNQETMSGEPSQKNLFPRIDFKLLIFFVSCQFFSYIFLSSFFMPSLFQIFSYLKRNSEKETQNLLVHCKQVWTGSFFIQCATASLVFICFVKNEVTEVTVIHYNITYSWMQIADLLLFLFC